MTTHMKYALLAVTMAMVPAASIAQQSGCASREIMEKVIHGTFSEVPIGRGLNTREYMVEIFANLQTGTWTAIGTMPLIDSNGGLVRWSCILSSGTAFSLISAPKEGEDG